VLVRTPTPDLLRAALDATPVEALPDGRLRVAGRTPEEVGHDAFAAGVELHELTHEANDLERIFLEMTADSPQPPDVPLASPGEVA